MNIKIFPLDELLKQSIEAKTEFVKTERDKILQAIHVIHQAIQSGNKLMIFGNGGSAADAQHMASEFLNRFRIERRPLPAIALTTDSSTLTSIANDYSFDEIFSKQIEALGVKGDVVLGISTSGNSKNVIKALQVSKKIGLHTISLTGGGGGVIRTLTDIHLNVGSTTITAHIQESHLFCIHVICECVDNLLFKQHD